MKLEHIVALAVRLFSIAIAIYAIRYLSISLPYVFNDDLEESTYILVILMFLLILLSIFLWKFPLLISRGITNFQEIKGTELHEVNGEQIQSVGLALLGVYFLYGVISDAVYWFYVVFITQRYPSSELVITLEHKALMLATVVEFLVAIYLLLGHKRISRLLHEFKYGKGS